MSQMMIERVAEALWRTHDERCSLTIASSRPGIKSDWSMVSGAERERFRTDAIAAIAAMREPTEAMNDAIVDVSPDRPHGDYWRAGIDAALAEEG